MLVLHPYASCTIFLFFYFHFLFSCYLTVCILFFSNNLPLFLLFFTLSHYPLQITWPTPLSPVKGEFSNCTVCTVCTVQSTH
jgi:hypothetical protein